MFAVDATRSSVQEKVVQVRAVITSGVVTVARAAANYLKSIAQFNLSIDGQKK